MDSGIDWDHYDNGPGSEAYKEKAAQTKRDFDQRRAREVAAERQALLDEIERLRLNTVDLENILKASEKTKTSFLAELRQAETEIERMQQQLKAYKQA